MALNQTDFLLTQDQIDLINQHFIKRSAQHASAGEDAACGAKVEIEWVPGLGRFVTAYFNGEVEGLEIEDGLTVT